MWQGWRNRQNIVLYGVIAVPCLVVSYPVFDLLDMGLHLMLTLRVICSVDKK